ncbi:hypothetical protein SHIRM173S_07742 [Streptomyces hirsutus]
MNWAQASQTKKTRMFWKVPTETSVLSHFMGSNELGNGQPATIASTAGTPTTSTSNATNAKNALTKSPKVRLRIRTG